MFHSIFMFFPTPLPEVIFGGSLRRSRPKSAMLSRFSMFLGSQNPPTPAGVRRFRLNKPGCRRRRLRRLALLTSRRPPGESKWLQKSHFSRPFSVSNFGIIFGMPFFRHFTPFGAPLAPLWLLLAILDPFWAPFWLPFGSLLLQICIPFSNLVFASFFHRFWDDF